MKSWKILLGLPALMLAMGTSSCAGTQSAYKEAETLDERAFVIAEHYAALVKEAADLAESGVLPENVKAALKAADRVANTAITGDATAVPPVPSLQALAANYAAVKNAETQLALQQALDSAVRAVAGLINAVKQARATLTTEVLSDPSASELLEATS